MAEHVRGTLAASGRRWDAALDHHLTALTVLDRLGVAHPGVVPVLPVAIQLAVLAERADVIAPLCERLGGAVSSPGSPWVEAQAMAARGHLMLVADDPSSLPALADAHARLDHLGYHLDAARLGCSLALAGLRFGRRREVRPALTAAYDLLLRQRILGWVELADELRQRVCGGPDLTRLTVTEKQVATLVADGSRNKEIAARLFVAESTVEAHLTRIYRKLGLRNRTDLTSQVRSGTSG